jgi:hypothetical protein
MTTVRLPVPPSVMPPLTVDPGAVETCGEQLRAACARLDDHGTFVGGPAHVATWSGVASRAYHAQLATIERDADAMSLALRRVAGRVLEHAAALVLLSTRHDDLLATSGRLAGGIEVLRRDVAAATPDRIVEVAPVLQARADTVAAHVASYEAERERWSLDLAAEERAMTSAFESLADLEDVVRRCGGTPDPADEALETLPPPGAPPDLVRAWWGGLTPAQRAGLLVAAPGAIGGLAGVPARARHDANTVRLARDLAALRSLRDRGLITADQRVVLGNAEAAASAVAEAEDLVDPRTGRPVPVRLYLYDPDAFGGDGAVAVAIGDPDRADDVSLIVPGLGSDATAIDGVADDATAVHRAARSLDGSATHASLAWIGYDAPDGFSSDGFSVAGEGRAERGGERLADAVDGLRAERVRAPADLSVIGHSYGSTTLGHAAHDHGLAADDLVVLGSPGLGGDVDHATDLGLDAGRVWVGADSRDPVAALAGNGVVHLGTLLGLGLGDDPAGADFGATRFQAESIHRGRLDDLGDHDRYFEHGSESLHHLAEIVTGHRDDVARAEPVRDPWWRHAVDPEHDRTPTTYDTGGD